MSDRAKEWMVQDRKGQGVPVNASPRSMYVERRNQHNESWWIDEARVSQLPQRQHHEAGFTPPGK